MRSQSRRMESTMKKNKLTAVKLGTGSQAMKAHLWTFLPCERTTLREPSFKSPKEALLSMTNNEGSMARF
jgi:hypothetical protein